MLYTRLRCGYCTAAERLLEAKGLDYEHHDVTGDHAARRRLVVETGQHTLPQIFIDGRSIGGYSEPRALERSGDLDRMLAAAPPAPWPVP